LCNRSIRNCQPPQDLNAQPRLSFEDESFDVVLITNTIEFLLDPRVVLREALR
jgi:ubiquinone/menaquinone biosynthesis C-methylase UbiE